jgi:tetratricopeptide (TPR) repeat protein
MKRSRQSKHMKKVRALVVGLGMCVAMQVCGADALTEALQKGLFEEEANQNLEAAIKAYQDVLGRAEEQRRIAATALFRLAECYRKQGKTNEASAEYRGLVRDYSEQATLVNLSRQNLVGLGCQYVSRSATTARKHMTLSRPNEEQQEIQRIRASSRTARILSMRAQRTLGRRRERPCTARRLKAIFSLPNTCLPMGRRPRSGFIRTRLRSIMQASTVTSEW